IRDTLHRRRAGTDDADALVGELGHRRPRPVAAGVVVVPPAGVEAVAREGFDAGNAGQLGPMQWAGAHGHETSPNLVATVGSDDPACSFLIPFEAGDGR